MRHLLKTFFDSSAEQAITALLDILSGADKDYKGTFQWGVTTIRACTSTTPTCTQNLTGAIIAMGNATTTFCPFNGASQPVCTGISVENLWLDAQGLAINAIANNYAQEQSYVKHVTLYQIAGTGLGVSPGTSGGTPQNSGPYLDISCTVNTGAAAGTVCARILNVSTRGIHGMTCINSSATIPDVTGAFCTRWNERIHRGGSWSWPSRGTRQNRS